MRTYVIKRLLLVIPTLILVTIIIFFVMRLLPGDIIDKVTGGLADVVIDRAALEHRLGLDVSLPVQFGRWLGVTPQADGSFSGIVQGDLGISWWAGRPVGELVAGAWPVTLQLSIMAMIAAQLIAFPIGVYSAVRQDSWGDYIGRSIAILCISVPGFWLATLLIVFPALWWGYMPPIMLIRFTEDPIGNLRMFIMPAIVLGMVMSGLTMRMGRTMMLEVLRQDYIRTAWSKGLRERVVVMRHALKNALIPIITIIGLQVPFLLGGAVIIEQIFMLPGLGRLLINACIQRDFPLMSGVLLLFALAIMLVNLAVDLTYAYLDPRLHYK